MSEAKVISLFNRPKAFLYLTTQELFRKVLDANAAMLGVDYYSDEQWDEIIDNCIEFFTDDRHPGMMLVDINYGQGGLCGCFYVAAGTYQLVKLQDEPLEHFK